MKYELFYLVGEKNEAQLDAIRAEVVEILTQEGAVLDEQELIEKRKLSYEIKHQSRGTYVTRRFDLPEVDFWADEANAEKEFGVRAITHKLNLHPQVLRSMVVKTEDLPSLGAKEERKARELKEKKDEKPAQKPGQRPMRNERPSFRRTEARPAPQAAKEEATAETKPETPKEAKEVKKEEKKDIDKQLDELLNI